jgi:hypothetical protein
MDETLTIPDPTDSKSEKRPGDAYTNAYYLDKQKERITAGKLVRLAFLDIDATLTGNNAAAEIVKHLLEELGYSVFYVTTRPEEMCMSKKQYHASLAFGLDRPQPLIDKSNPKQLQYCDPAADPNFRSVIDPSGGIASETGNRIMIGQTDTKGHLNGYTIDRNYEARLAKGSDNWREDTLAILKEFDRKSVRKHLSPIDREGAYQQNKSAHALLPYRINLDFNAGVTIADSESAAKKLEQACAEKDNFIQRFRKFQAKYCSNKYHEELQKLRTKYNQKFADALQDDYKIVYLEFYNKEIAAYQQEEEELQRSYGLNPHKIATLYNIRFVEDSNPEEGRYSIYVMPALGHKARASNEIVRRTCKELGIEQSQLELLIAGDSSPDLAMGLHTGLGTYATFILTGGSRLTAALTDNKISGFAGESFKAIKKRLIEQTDGRYYFDQPFSLPKRAVIIGDYAYPNTKGPETIQAFLKEQQLKE